jgi:hypothetical protein
MQSKTLPIVLPPAMYERLQREGRAQERDVVQQARWILKQALSDSNDPGVSPDPKTAA